ncbi:hypothetical protein [Algoriphagus sediminis]|uniref:Outer membrane protein beta-barrel domain-containing protein n=1 Tax=Algoriphagus sediminis TaxID=3057113 RepID=A0ABT7YBI8_9BACT|nr:hypothetical protein [Algoriphagus sediminis]MDN3203884.1 hypothetical protein [Algoriphagus sediminis]
MKKIFILSFLVLGWHLANAQEKVDSLDNNYKIEKGRFFTSLTASLSQRSAENENQILRQVKNQNRYRFRIVGAGGYAIKDNFMVGLAGGYGRSKEDITFLNENQQEVTTQRLEQGFSIVPNMRNYIPLGRGQLQILVQTEFGLTFGESLQRNFYESEIDKIESEFIEINVGVSPGLVLFFDRHWAFETTVGIAGLSTRIEESITNDDLQNKTRIVQNNVDLRINLLNLNLGVAYYF